MKVLACDADWVVSGGATSCPGTLHSVEANQIPQGMTIDDVNQLTGSALELFAIVFGFLVLKKALK